MTYESMIQWAIDEGLDFDGFIEEFGDNFRFLEPEFRSQMPIIEREDKQSQPEISEELEQLDVPKTTITDSMRGVLTSFIKFFRGN